MYAYWIERDTLGTDLSAAELERLLDPRRMLAADLAEG